MFELSHFLTSLLNYFDQEFQEKIKIKYKKEINFEKLKWILNSKVLEFTSNLNITMIINIKLKIEKGFFCI